jgi:hypothetical protein
MKGTWQVTGGGPDMSWLAGLGAAAGVAAAAAVVVTELLWVIAALSAALIIALPVAWFATRGYRARRRAEVVARWAATREAAEEDRRRRALERHQRRLEIARAAAPVVQNVIDPAALIAAALAVQPDPARVVRGEVER